MYGNYFILKDIFTKKFLNTMLNNLYLNLFLQNYINFIPIFGGGGGEENSIYIFYAEEHFPTAFLTWGPLFFCIWKPSNGLFSF